MGYTGTNLHLMLIKIVIYYGLSSCGEGWGSVESRAPGRLSERQNLTVNITYTVLIKGAQSDK
jgi:hypothetical protein